MGLPPALVASKDPLCNVCKGQLIQICAHQLDTNGMVMNDFQKTFQGFAVKLFQLSGR